MVKDLHHCGDTWWPGDRHQCHPLMSVRSSPELGYAVVDPQLVGWNQSKAVILSLHGYWTGCHIIFVEEDI
jgi:hypothetical protein